MAQLDDLIKQIKEPKLRADLTSALKKFRSQKRFGLVFEEHIPETVALPNYPIDEGATVVLRSDIETKKPFVVSRIDGTKAVILPEKGQSEPTTVKLTDLTVIKRFGEPIYPTLSPVGTTNLGEDRASHSVINGENFHAAQFQRTYA